MQSTVQVQCDDDEETKERKGQGITKYVIVTNWSTYILAYFCLPTLVSGRWTDNPSGVHHRVSQLRFYCGYDIFRDHKSTMAAATSPSGLLTVPRITTLLASLLVALGSGTNYVCDSALRTELLP